MSPPPRSRTGSSRAWSRTLMAAAALGACAWVVRRQTRRAEAAHPPHGRFVEVDGVRLHLVERGERDAPALLLLHGNGAMAQEIELSGLVGRAAVRYRVLAFDRPGYGHSDRPADRAYPPEEQARLLIGALQQLGIEQAIVLGHSWGTLVALEMALQAPQVVRSLVLEAGYYHPAPRLDVAWMAAPALPVIGRLMRHTVSPLLSRLLWPAFAWRMFAPREVTEPFRSEYPVWMSLRPKQVQANAAESAMMIPAAMKLRSRYAELRTPVVIVAGDSDRMVTTTWHSQWLHEQLPGSALRIVPGAGHMVHHVATHQVMKAIDQADQMAQAAWGAQQLGQWVRQGTQPRPATAL